LRRESPKRGRRLPLPEKVGRPIGTKKGERGYRRSSPIAELAEVLSNDFTYVKPPYELIDHTADLGMRVRGESLENLFENAGLALFDILTDVTLVRRHSRSEISLKAESVEDLFVAWLRELLYLFYVRKKLFCAFQIIKFKETSLAAVCWGEQYDSQRHILLTEIKAVTYHELSITRTQSGWEAQAIFDV